ncbi:hypothetical protein ACTXGK_04440 [Psychrobacter sp. T6-5]|uniref:hypothetical protein n=1 Tax=Psychrobacter sp. T6-5 TaxID=3457451 RepID=UPI003FD599C8
MNKFFSVLVLGSALVLSACGGDSDSSGSYGSSEPVQFQGLSNCAISGNTITVNEIGRGCLVKKSNINNGKKFSLSCQIVGTPPRGYANFSIITTKDGDGDEIKRDIESANGKYDYVCKPMSSQFPTSGLSG